MKRDRYEVAPKRAAAGRRWTLKRNGELLLTADTQGEAVESAVRLARMRLKDHKQTAELVIKGRDGKIRDSRTYGRDPRASPG